MIQGTFIMVACYVLFYLMTAWVLSYGIGKADKGGLAIPYREFLIIQLISIIGFAIFIPISGWLADKYGRRTQQLWTTSRWLSSVCPSVCSSPPPLLVPVRTQTPL